MFAIQFINYTLNYRIFNNRLVEKLLNKEQIRNYLQDFRIILINNFHNFKY